MNLSEHFTLKEATFSRTAEDRKIENIPDAEQLERMKFTAAKMELVRELLGNNPIKINSWFRGPELNRAVGGVPTSQHARGEAVDFTSAWFGSARDICLFLQKKKGILEYDQLILEPAWVHISFTLTNPRMNELTFLGQGRYVKGIS